MDLVKSKVQASGHSFTVVKASDMPATATLVFRIEGDGKVDDLLLCPRRGVVRLNGWPAEARQGIRILRYPELIIYYQKRKGSEIPARASAEAARRLAPPVPSWCSPAKILRGEGGKVR